MRVSDTKLVKITLPCFKSLTAADLSRKDDFDQLFNFQGPVISECTIETSFIILLFTLAIILGYWARVDTINNNNNNNTVSQQRKNTTAGNFHFIAVKFVQRCIALYKSAWIECPTRTF